MFDVIIIGAGLSGSLSALNVSPNLSVLLIESGNDILPTTSSSYNECYKLHTGLHYVGDRDTGKNCLMKSIEFAREFPDCIAGGADLQSPWRRGRHYFMSNSLVSLEETREIALELQAFYSKMIIDNPNNKVFGEPDDFIKFLTRDDYLHVNDNIPFYDKNNNISTISVGMGIESAESQIDIHRLKLHLQKLISMNSNITFIPYTTVIDLSYNTDELGYIVIAKNNQGETKFFSQKLYPNLSLTLYRMKNLRINMH